MIARKKPDVSHYKAGNVNNFLYNYCSDSASKGETVHQYMLLLDHDMLPAPSILQESISHFSNHKELAFVQFPQRFYDIPGKDRFYAGNEIFFDGVQMNRSSIGLAAFAGTNAVWRMSVFYFVTGGMKYGSLTEDANTGHAAHRAGYDSLYIPCDLCVGQSPQTSICAMKQRMRWSQGAIEMLFCPQSKVADCPSILKSEYETIEMKHQSLWKIVVKKMIYLDSMVYPLYSIGYLFHVIVSVLYLYNTQPPMAPSNASETLIVWLPLYFIKACTQILAFQHVSLEVHMRAQQAWAGYALSTAVSVFRSFTGSVWFNTGSGGGGGHDGSWLQYNNLVIFIIIVAAMISRVIIFTSGADDTCNSPWMSMGALFYGVMMMYLVTDYALEPLRHIIYIKYENWRNKKNLNSVSDPHGVYSSAMRRSIHMRSSFRQSEPDLNDDNTDSTVSIEDVNAPEQNDNAFFFNINKNNSIITETQKLFDVKGETKDEIFKARTNILKQHVQYLVQIREAYEKHSFNLSLVVIIVMVFVASSSLFAWASNSTCNIASIEESNKDIPQPPLPKNLSASVDFQAVSGGLLLNGKPFFLKGANWFGFETDRKMAFGLNIASQDKVFEILSQNGINALRLPLTVEAVNNPQSHIAPKWAVDQTLNSHLRAEMNYLDAVEAFIHRAAQWGIFVLLDMHLLRADTAPDPLPFDEKTPLHEVVLAWDTLASRMCTFWGVMGADLKNEPYGATWEEWQNVAMHLAETVENKCPSWLIFVEGIWSFDSPKNPVKSGRTGPWGSMLLPAKDSPIRILNENKLVYSPHIYGPGTIKTPFLWENETEIGVYLKKNCLRQINGDVNTSNEISKECNDLGLLKDTPFPFNVHIWYDFWFGFLQSDFNKTVVIGEWGGTYLNQLADHFSDLSNNEEKARYRILETMWQEETVKYLLQKGFGAFYWSVNPESIDTGGLLLSDWVTPDTAKFSLLEVLPSSQTIRMVLPRENVSFLSHCLEKSKIYEVLYEEDSGPRYDKESNVYNKDFDGTRKPAAIVFPRTENEVSHAVRCSYESDLQICIRSGGHSYTADSTCDGGVLVDLLGMKSIRKIEGTSSQFLVESGNTMGDLTTTLHNYGRIAPVGNHHGVGMGFLLGCGRGLLSRSFRLGCDYIVSARMVTSNGTIIEVTDENEHKDLIWALRGAGAGHFGVVTSLVINTYPLPETESFHHFQLAWSRDQSKEVLSFWQEWAIGHENTRFTCNLILWNPKVTSIQLQGAFWGTKEELDRILLNPLQTLGSPNVDERSSFHYLDFVAHVVGSDDVLQLRNPHSGYSGKRRSFHNKSHLIFERLNLEGIATFLTMANEDIVRSGAYDNYIEISPLGGEISSLASSRPSAFSHRSAIAVAQYGGYWSDDESKSMMLNHQRRFRRSMEQFWGNRAFYNYKDNELINWEESYWGETSHKKLLGVKCQYDPGNSFSTMRQSLKC